MAKKTKRDQITRQQQHRLRKRKPGLFGWLRARGGQRG
jgi:hypothetical protein